MNSVNVEILLCLIKMSVAKIQSVSLLMVGEISPFVYRKRNAAPGSNEILCLEGVHQI